MNELATIRQAYRYVVAYERRILDAFARADSVLQEQQFERKTPHRWEPMYTPFPSRAWAPDQVDYTLVPGFACRYRWQLGGDNVAGTRYVLIEHVADTVFEQHFVTRRSVPDPLLDFAAVDSARSVLRWLSLEQTHEIPASVWNLAWPSILDRQLGPPSVQAALMHPSKVLQREGGGLALTASCIDLESVADAEDFERVFLSPLRAALVRSVL